MEENLSVAVRVAALAIQLGVILFTARFCGAAATKLRIPSVLGELIAGIVIGPYVLGALPLPLHGFHHGLFPLAEGAAIPVSLPLYGIATLGSIILLFMSGLETDLRMFFRYSVVGTVVGLGGVIFSFVFGAGLGVFALKASFMDPRCLFLGILCTATSVGITARILSEKRSIDSPEGTTILAAAVIDDVLGIICLAIVMGIAAASGSGGSIAWSKIGVIAVKSFGIWLGVTALGLVFAHKIAAFLKMFKGSVNFSVLAFGLAMLLAGLFEQAGLAMIVGAYVMGLCLSKTDIAFSIQRPLTPVYNLLVPVFFVVMGMLVDIRVMTNPVVLKLGLIYSILAIAAKVIGCALPALFMNFNAIGALRIGAGMIPRGEVALIIAGIGATTMMNLNGESRPIIDPELFGVAIIMTLITTLAAPPILSAILAVKKKGVRHEKADAKLIRTEYAFPSDIIREFVMRDMIPNFRNEGFRHSEYAKDSGVITFRKESSTFSLMIDGNNFCFESAERELDIIKAVMYETIVGLHQSLTQLKELATPERMDQVLSGSKASPIDRSIKMEKILAPNCVVFLNGKNKKDVIEEMVRVLDQERKLTDTQICIDDVLAREEVITTCMPGGIALPHGRTDGAKELVSVIGISKDGVLCDAPDGKPTHVFVLSVCPKEAHAPYLRYVSMIARVLDGYEAVQNICQINDTAEIRRTFLNMKGK